MDTDLVKFRALRARLIKDKKLELRVASTSMEPVILKDQFISVIEVNPKELQKFDIIVFWESNKIFCHYVWHKQQDHSGENIYITKSLENPRCIDLPIKENLILGKVEMKIPWYLKLKMWMKNLSND